MKYVALLLLSLVPTGCFAQTVAQGTNQVQGILQVNSQISRYVQIMALFPPAYNPAAGSDYLNFRSHVMSQGSIDGVTLEIVWSNVETQAASPTSCGTPTDTCQKDAVGQYHQYDWSAYDTPADMSHKNSVVPWFDPFGSVYKKVNFILTGINTSAGGNSVNGATPWYVTSSGYAANFPATYNRQDVLNTVTCPSATAPWKGIPGATYIRGGGSSTVTVTSSSCCGAGNLLQANDLIWVYNGGDMNNMSAPAATPIISVTYPSTFTYASQNNIPVSGCSLCVYITASQSSPVPYEQPYTVAWEAFLAAANLHFGPSYPGTIGSAGTNQLGYVRSGTWVGGESFLYCPTDLGSLNAPYKYIGTSTWTGDYQSKVNYVESLSPTMLRYWPIDPGTDPDTMALYAISAANGHGFINGFGSQGLSAADAQTTCAGANADWCGRFAAYYSLGMPLELQQISISDESQNCMMAGACGTPPKSAGDLRLWLPYAVSKHATVFEMYYLDLALAFDSQYCTVLSTGTCMSGATCTSGYTPNSSYMNTTQQATWACAVGLLNTSCPGGIGCYGSSINGNHGPM